MALDYQAFRLFTSIHMFNTTSDPGLYFISQNLGSLFNTCGLIVFLPIVNFASSFVYSSSSYSKRSLRVKMGIGYGFLVLSSLALFCVARFHNLPAPLASLLLLLVPAVFLFLSEMFGMVTGKEMCGARLLAIYYVILSCSVGIHLCPVPQKYQRSPHWTILVYIWLLQWCWSSSLLLR